MRAKHVLRALIFSVLLALACKSEPAPQQSSAAAQPATQTLCEHGVQGDLCPKCNPELAAIYQKQGDWCAEHQMPESFCPICHPDKKGKPSDAPSEQPAKASAKAPTDGMKVKLKSEAIVEGAGIVTAVSVKAPAKTSMRFPARLVYDATRTAEITANAGGVIRVVSVDLGAKVKAGTVLATLDSADVGGDRSKLLAAQRRFKAAEDRLARVQTLEKEGVLPLRERVNAELAVDEARAEVSALSTELGIAGAGSGKGGSYTISSPIDGIVTRRSASIGKLVEQKDPLFQVVDPTVMWAEIDVPEMNAGSIQEGAEVVVTVPTIPDEPFAGLVASVLPEVNPQTRTVTARVSLKNPRQRLRANMFGEAAVVGKTPEGGVLIPRAAIQTVDRTRFVFVRKEPLVYQVRHVTVPSKDGASALVTAGLEAGEEIVTVGSFLLKTETLKDSIGAGCCADD
ncbi:MAG: efflux RND transporter periplasmic adaptor subunit [Myxococcales bacterium]|nr:efflux RND transporter periplasmic adaptor subunit [Myxococcales bacterium]